jgi:hypothetical protein
LGFCFIEDGDDRTLWIASLTPPLSADVPEFAGGWGDDDEKSGKND